MTSLLENYVICLTRPDRGSTGFAALADEDVSRPELIPMNFVFFDEDFLKVS
jgi:hypothetical protein